MSSTFDFEKIQCHKLYINGQFVDAIKGGTFFTINPALKYRNEKGMMNNKIIPAKIPMVESGMITRFAGMK